MSRGPGPRCCTMPACRSGLKQPFFWLGVGTGLVALAGIFYRLGLGRLSAFYYQCVLLTIWLVIGAALCVVIAAHFHAHKTGCTTRIVRASGPLVFLMVFLGFYGIAQGVYWYVNTTRATHIHREGTHSTGESYSFDRVLGYGPKPNFVGEARLVVDGATVYDYVYTTDAQRRRIVPASPASGGPYARALLLFGGSYAFGEGVDDHQTLAHELAKRLPDTRVYNYAFSGYGPGQMLARLESYDLRAEVAEEEVAALYVFIPNHVRRVNGSYSVINWSRHSPYYRIDASGQAERLGSFQGERQILTRWYDFLRGDQVFQYFQVDFPPVLADRHFRLTTAIIDASRNRFGEVFQTPAFTVILYPQRPQDEFSNDKLTPYLKKAGLSVLDYTHLFPPDLSGVDFSPHDAHPTAKAYALLAEAIADEALFEPPSANP